VNPKTVRSVNDYLNNTNLNAYGYNFPINFLGNTLLDNIALYDVTGTTNCGIVCGQSDYIIGTPSGLFAFPGHDYRAGYSPLLSTFDTTYVYFTNMGNRIRKFTLYDFVEYGSYVTVPETITGICNDGTYLYVMSANHLYTLSCADRSLVSTDDLVYGAYGIAVDNQRLYIVDTPNDEVVVLNKYDKTVITTLGGFDNPSGICLISNT
jgi:YVTN family beta-propeller protein